LLVGLDELGLRGVLLPTDAGGQHVVDRCLVTILLDVHGGRSDRPRLCRAVIKILLIDSPCAPDEVQTAKAHHHRMLESGEEHAHEADAAEVGDGAYPALKLVDGNAKQVPCDLLGRAIAQRRHGLALVDDEVSTHREIAGTYRNMILIVFLVLVQGKILIDILNVRGGLV